VVFVVDVSGSTTDPFGGTPVGDRNADGLANTILDGEIAAFEVMNQALIARGLGTDARVATVIFSTSATAMDMLPGQPGTQMSAVPSADSNGNGVTDVIEVLRGLRGNGRTNFREALEQAAAVFTAMGTSPGNGNLVFLSDGLPNEGGSYDSEVQALKAQGVKVRAFGVGAGASLASLVRIDPAALVVTNTDQLIGVFNDLSAGGRFDELPLPGVVVYLDTDNDGNLDVTERYSVTGTNGFYCFTNLPSGCYQVRQQLPEGYLENVPGTAGDHLVCAVNTQPMANWNFGDKALNRFIPAKDGNTVKNFIRFQGGMAELRYAADRGVPWAVQHSTDLNHWTTITNVVGSTNAVTIRDPMNTAARPNVYYRAVRQ
jgi:hypothetical protein